MNFYFLILSFEPYTFHLKVDILTHLFTNYNLTPGLHSHHLKAIKLIFKNVFHFPGIFPRVCRGDQVWVPETLPEDRSSNGLVLSLSTRTGQTGNVHIIPGEMEKKQGSALRVQGSLCSSAPRPWLLSIREKCMNLLTQQRPPPSWPSPKIV